MGTKLSSQLWAPTLDMSDSDDGWHPCLAPLTRGRISLGLQNQYCLGPTPIASGTKTSLHVFVVDIPPGLQKPALFGPVTGGTKASLSVFGVGHTYFRWALPPPHPGHIRICGRVTNFQASVCFLQKIVWTTQCKAKQQIRALTCHLNYEHQNLLGPIPSAGGTKASLPFRVGYTRAANQKLFGSDTDHGCTKASL